MEKGAQKDVHHEIRREANHGPSDVDPEIHLQAPIQNKKLPSSLRTNFSEAECPVDDGVWEQWRQASQNHHLQRIQNTPIAFQGHVDDLHENLSRKFTIDASHKRGNT